MAYGSRPTSGGRVGSSSFAGPGRDGTAFSAYAGVRATSGRQAGPVKPKEFKFSFQDNERAAAHPPPHGAKTRPASAGPARAQVRSEMRCARKPRRPPRRTPTPERCPSNGERGGVNFGGSRRFSSEPTGPIVPGQRVAIDWSECNAGVFDRAGGARGIGGVRASP